MKNTVNILSISLFLLFLCGIAVAQNIRSGFTPTPTLTVNHAVIDPGTGDLLVISNSMHNVRPNLRRFHADGEAATDFVLHRFEACCAISPTLVTVGGDGSIYTLEYTGQLTGSRFYIYKHAPAGELDIDWGERTGSTDVLTPLSGESNYSGGVANNQSSGGGYNSGETTLDWNAGGGRLTMYLSDPVDIAVRSDNSLLILDRMQKYVYLISPDGRDVATYIGKHGYYPIRPQRLQIDSEDNVYLVDYYNEWDINRKGLVGVFKFAPDGTWQQGWGEGSNSINDPYRPTLDMNTVLVDGADNLLALGGSMTDWNHSEVYTFNRADGVQITRDNVQFRTGYDKDFLGIAARPEGGFVIIDGFGFELLVSRYSLDGVREEHVRIDNLYTAE